MERRTFLFGALGTTAALALGVSLYRPELALEEADDNEHRLLLQVLLPVLLDGALPEMASPRDVSINRTLNAISATLKVLPDTQRDELFTLLQLLENRLGLLLLSGSMTPLLMRNQAELELMLNHWREHSIALFQQAYLGLRELILASYYSCPEHWASLNYAKPELPGINDER